MDQEPNPTAIDTIFNEFDTGLTNDLQTLQTPDAEVSADLLEVPVEYPIDNQPQLVSLLKEEAPQTVDVISERLGPELVVAAEAISDLLDLHRTVLRSGVSSHDMNGLLSIQNRLSENNITLPTVALEDYGIYTPTRSFLNHQVSLENIAKVVIDTIKGWIRKLIDLVMQGYRWVKGLRQKHAVLDQQLVKARDVLVGVRDIYLKMKVLNGPHSTESAAAISELNQAILYNSDLPRNRVTLYGFSDESATKDVKRLFDSARATAESVSTRIKTLDELISNNDIPSDDGLCGLKDLAQLSQSVDEIQALSSDPDYLIEKLGDDFWNKVERFRKVKVIDFDELVKYYGNAADALARLRAIKIEDQAQAERVQTVIDSVTTAVDHLNKIVTFFNLAAHSQVQAAKSYREYYSKAIEIMLVEFKTKNPSEASVKEMKGFVSALQALK